MKLRRVQAQPTEDTPLQMSEGKTETSLLKDELIHCETRTRELRAYPLMRFRHKGAPRRLLVLVKVLDHVKSFLGTCREARCNHPRSNGHPFFKRPRGGLDDENVPLRANSFIPI